jgi:hypothetical protein
MSSTGISFSRSAVPETAGFVLCPPKLLSSGPHLSATHPITVMDGARGSKPRWFTDRLKRVAPKRVCVLTAIHLSLKTQKRGCLFKDNPVSPLHRNPQFNPPCAKATRRATTSDMSLSCEFSSIAIALPFHGRSGHSNVRLVSYSLFLVLC